MRYLRLVSRSLPLFCCSAAWGILSLRPIIGVCAALGGLGCGFLLGCRMARAVRMQLLHGEPLPFRRFPGGVWTFFAVAFALGVTGGVMMTRPTGSLLVHVAAVALSTGIIGAFGKAGLSVRALERETGLDVLVDSDGFSFAAFETQ